MTVHYAYRESGALLLCTCTEETSFHLDTTPAHPVFSDFIAKPSTSCLACRFGLCSTVTRHEYCFHDNHPQGVAYCPLTEDLVGADVLIIPVLEKFWSLGVDTWVSCQEDGVIGWVSILYPDPDDVRSILKNLDVVKYSYKNKEGSKPQGWFTVRLGED